MQKVSCRDPTSSVFRFYTEGAEAAAGGAASLTVSPKSADGEVKMMNRGANITEQHQVIYYSCHPAGALVC